MRFGTAVVPGPEPRPWAAHLERSGFALLGVADSPSLYPELLTALGPVTSASTTATVATWVTNPVLRHPLVLASGIAALEHAAPGRVAVGIGTGDSALHNAGLAPATLATTTAYLAATRDLLTEGRATWRGAAVHLRAERPRGEPPPFLLAASGPRGLRAAGAIADGAVIGAPIDDAGIEHALGLVADGAGHSGRDPSALQLWWNVKVTVAASREDAIDQLAPGLAARAHYAYRHTLDGVPPALRHAVAELVERYEPLAHGELGREVNGALVRELGLAEHLAGRFAVAGTPDECIDRLRAMQRLGVRNVFTMLTNRELGSTDPFVAEVLPALTGS